MATKDHCLPFNEKEKFFRGDSFNGQYNSLNLNQNKQCFPEDTGKNQEWAEQVFGNIVSHLFERAAASTKSLDSTFGNNSQQRNNPLSWENSKHNFSTNLYHKTFNQQKESHQNGFERKSSNNSNNNSTLSLHIEAYENSSENKTDSKCNGNKNIGIKKEKNGLIKKWKNGFVSGMGGGVQNPFEFPRQNDDDQTIDPEVMQFKTTHQVLNPNSTTGTDGTTPSIVGTVLTESRISVQPGFQAKDWTVLSLCGSGSGDVYKVRHRKTEEIGAMKIESVKKIDESCLFNESKIYRALIKHTLGAKHVAEMLAFEQLEGNLNTQFLIMGFLGPNIKELKEKCGGKFDLSTVLRIGIQTLCGIKMIHDVGYVHRHLRPACFMLGNPDIPQKSRLVYVTDFQIARRFLKRAKNNMGIYREEREPGSVRMHGYIRYVSVSVHNGNEHRCRDDIWSWIYILAELLDKLPWQNLKVDPTKVHALKMITPDSQLFASIKARDPKGYLTSILEYIRTVHADSKPDYVGIYRRLKNAATMCGAKFTDPYDWEPMEQPGDSFLSDSELYRYFAHEEMQIVRKGDQRVELDPMFFRDDSSPQAVRRAPRARHNTESLEIPTFLDVDATQNSLTSAPSGRGSVKKTVRKDVTLSKKKMAVKENNGGDGSGKKTTILKKLQRKKSSKENSAAAGVNNNEQRDTMPFFSPKSPKVASDEKERKDEKRRESAVAAGGGTTTVAKSAPQMSPSNGRGPDSSKRKKKNNHHHHHGKKDKKEKKEKKREESSSKRTKKKKKRFQHHDNDMTVDKTRDCTKDESSSKEDSSSDANPPPPPSIKKSHHRSRAIKSSSTAGKERKKQSTKGTGSKESKSRESSQARKKSSQRRKH